MVPYIAANIDPVGATHDEWATVVEVPGTHLVNGFTLINEGDEPGFFRLVDTDGNQSNEGRLLVGGGDTGHRRAAFNIVCPGFSGKVQVRAGRVGGRLAGIFAIGQK